MALTSINDDKNRGGRTNPPQILQEANFGQNSNLSILIDEKYTRPIGFTRQVNMYKINLHIAFDEPKIGSLGKQKTLCILF